MLLVVGMRPAGAQIDLSIFDGSGVEEPGEAPEPPETAVGEPGEVPDTGEMDDADAAERSPPVEGMPEAGAPHQEDARAAETREAAGEDDLDDNGDSLLGDAPLVPEMDAPGEDAGAEVGDEGGDDGDADSGLPGADAGEEDETAGTGEDGAAETAEGEAESEPGSETEAEPPAGGEGEGAGVPPREPGRATEVFQPTERIRVDQSVDFPWDI